MELKKKRESAEEDIEQSFVEEKQTNDVVVNDVTRNDDIINLDEESKIKFINALIQDYDEDDEDDESESPENYLKRSESSESSDVTSSSESSSSSEEDDENKPDYERRKHHCKRTFSKAQLPYPINTFIFCIAVMHSNQRDR